MNDESARKKMHISFIQTDTDVPVLENIILAKANQTAWAEIKDRRKKLVLD